MVDARPIAIFRARARRCDRSKFRCWSARPAFVQSRLADCVQVGHSGVSTFSLQDGQVLQHNDAEPLQEEEKWVAGIVVFIQAAIGSTFLHPRAEADP